MKRALRRRHRARTISRHRHGSRTWMWICAAWCRVGRPSFRMAVRNVGDTRTCRHLDGGAEAGRWVGAERAGPRRRRSPTPSPNTRRAAGDWPPVARLVEAGTPAVRLPSRRQGRSLVGRRGADLRAGGRPRSGIRKRRSPGTPRSTLPDDVEDAVVQIMTYPHRERNGGADRSQPLHRRSCTRISAR